MSAGVSDPCDFERKKPVKYVSSLTQMLAIGNTDGCHGCRSQFLIVYTDRMKCSFCNVTHLCPKSHSCVNNGSEKSKFNCLGMFNYVVKFVGGEQLLILVAYISAVLK